LAVFSNSTSQCTVQNSMIQADQIGIFNK